MVPALWKRHFEAQMPQPVSCQERCTLPLTKCYQFTEEENQGGDYILGKVQTQRQEGKTVVDSNKTEVWTEISKIYLEKRLLLLWKWLSRTYKYINILLHMQTYHNTCKQSWIHTKHSRTYLWKREMRKSNKTEISANR